MPDPEGMGDICSAHFIPAEALKVKQVVRAVDWCDGQPVRIDEVVHGDHDEDGPVVAVRYQDAAAHHPAVTALVPEGFLVLPAGGAR